MGALLSRSVAIQLSNNTQNITLRNPRIHFDYGRCSIPPMPELSPGSCNNCHFPNSFLFQGVSGVLVYEAESFTLAIYFSNPFDYNQYSMELGLELSPDRVHRDSLEDTYARMASGSYSSSRQDIQFDRGVVNRSDTAVQVSNGPVKVTATMSNTTDCVVKVTLQELREQVEEAETENRSRRRHFQEM